MIRTIENQVINQLEKQHKQMEACVDRRNRVEFIAGGVAMALLTVIGGIGLWRATDLPDVTVALGFVLVAAGLAFTPWRLNRHIVTQRVDAVNRNADAVFVGRSRSERDFLRSVPGWYIGPLLPSFALIWGGLFADGSVGTAVAGSIMTAATITWIVRANFQAAAEYDRQIREIDEAAT